MEIETPIHITEQEQLICSLILQTINHFQLKTTVRAVGGWVRDKLLGKESHDFDITVDNMKAEEFSNYFQQYVNEKTNYRINGIGNIKLNKDKGKHLETSTLIINGTPIDICCLRPDDYCQSSDGKIGTPLEDARRRDFTINSMFYNINQNIIEDFTEMGRNDLEKGIIRTPIAPRITLEDDPARSLRAIRFSSKMGFIIDEELEQEMCNVYIVNKMNDGISRERIGKELIGMIETGRVGYCFEFIQKCQYFTNIFGEIDDDTTVAIIKSYEHYAKQFNCFDSIEHREIGVLAALTWLESNKTVVCAKKTIGRVQDIILNKIKLSVKEKNNTILVHKGVEELMKLKNEKKLESEEMIKQLERVELGRIVLEAGDFWKESLFVFASIESPNYQIIGIPTHEIKMNELYVSKITQIIEMIQLYQLENVHKLKPFVNGKEIAEILNRKAGSWLNMFLRDEIEYQIAHPQCTKDEVVVFLSNWNKV